MNGRTRQSSHHPDSVWIVRIFMEDETSDLSIEVVSSPAKSTIAVVAVEDGKGTVLGFARFGSGKNAASLITGAPRNLARARLGSNVGFFKTQGTKSHDHPEGIFAVVAAGSWTMEQMATAAVHRASFPGAGTYRAGAVLKLGPGLTFTPKGPREINITTLGPDAFLELLEFRYGSGGSAGSGALMMSRAPANITISASRGQSSATVSPVSEKTLGQWEVCLAHTSSLNGTGDTTFQRTVGTDTFTKVLSQQTIAASTSVEEDYINIQGASPPPDMQVTVSLSSGLVLSVSEAVLI